MTADEFLQFETLLIMGMGLVAFVMDTFDDIIIGIVTLLNHWGND